MGDDEPPPPGTIQDLTADAAELGLADFTARTASEWHRRGLLGSPARQSLGYGNGQAPALYSSEQRALFAAVVRNKVSGSKADQLANIPIWAWLYQPDGFVTPEQVRRALRTAVGPLPRKTRRNAQRLASAFAKSLDLNRASNQAVGRLKACLTSLLVDGPQQVQVTELRRALAEVWEPRRVAVVRGPAKAPLDLDTVMTVLLARIMAARKLDRHTDEELILARRRHQEGWAEYLAMVPELQRQAEPQVAALYADVELNEQVARATNTFLLQLGLPLLHETAPTTV
jgi:hypothetical protein